MKQRLRNYIAKIASFLEIFISALTLLGIVLFSLLIIKDLYDISISILNGNFELNVENFLSHALQLIIGIEFIKMLAKHTPGSAVEVLLFAIARKMIIETNTMFDVLIGVVAIGILFAVRKFLNTTKYETHKGIIFNGGTYVHEVNKVTHSKIPSHVGHTIAGVLYNVAKDHELPIKTGCSVDIEGTKIEVYSMDGDLIKQVIVHKPS